MSEEIVFENGKPTYQGDNIAKCFRQQGNGLFFRIINEKEKKWAFYNDTKRYNMKVIVIFGPHSDVTALGNTSLTRDGNTGECVCEVTVGPMTTEMFIEGDVNGFKMRFEANPIPKS